MWNVDPSHAERRTGAERRRVSRGPDRRQQKSMEPRVRLSRPELVLGWLAFEADHEKRRLYPVPQSWEQLDTTGLEQLLAEATPVIPPRRLLE